MDITNKEDLPKIWHSLNIYHLLNARAHHAVTGTLNEKLWQLHRGIPFGGADELELNTALLDYANSCIAFIEFAKEHVDEEFGNTTSVAHDILRKWRNTIHHDHYLPFKPVETHDWGTDFFLNPVIVQATRMKDLPQRNMMSKVTLGDLISENQGYLRDVITKIEDLLQQSMAQAGIGVAYMKEYPIAAMAGGQVYTPAQFWSEG